MAGTGCVTCRIKSPSGTEIDIDIVENGDGTFSIIFTPGVEGDYNINIKFGGNLIPDGEYCIQVSHVTFTLALKYTHLCAVMLLYVYMIHCRNLLKKENTIILPDQTAPG